MEGGARALGDPEAPGRAHLREAVDGAGDGQPEQQLADPVGARERPQAPHRVGKPLRASTSRLPDRASGGGGRLDSAIVGAILGRPRRAWSQPMRRKDSPQRRRRVSAKSASGMDMSASPPATYPRPHG